MRVDTVTSTEMVAVEGLLTLGIPERMELGVQVEPERKDFSCQVTSGDFKTHFCDLIDSPKKLVTATGLDTFAKLSALVLSFGYLQAETNRGNFSNRSKVLLTLMKLKLNLSFAFMAIFFSCPATTCKNVFASTVITLSGIL
jgi:hypothetical protein